MVTFAWENHDADSSLQLAKHFSCITLAYAGEIMEVPDSFLIAHRTGAELLDMANRFLSTVVFAHAPWMLQAGCTAFEIAVYDAEMQCWIILVAMGGKIGERATIHANEEEYTRLFAKEGLKDCTRISHVKIYIRGQEPDTSFYRA